MTTNAISSKDLQKQPLGFGGAVKNPDPFELLVKTFPREFLGRIDEIIPFRSLTSNDLKKIMRLRVNEAIERLHGKGIRLIFDEVRLMEYLMDGLANEQSGARGIARLLEKKLLQPLAVAMLQSGQGKETVVELGEEFYESGIATCTQ